METKKPDDASKKKRKWRRSVILRRAWAVLCLFVLLSLIVSMTVNGY